jgi:hypothetical protein
MYNKFSGDIKAAAASGFNDDINTLPLDGSFKVYFNLLNI